MEHEELRAMCLLDRVANECRLADPRLAKHLERGWDRREECVERCELPVAPDGIDCGDGHDYRSLRPPEARFNYSPSFLGRQLEARDDPFVADLGRGEFGVARRHPRDPLFRAFKKLCRLIPSQV
jgi:hypothetical protein